MSDWSPEYEALRARMSPLTKALAAVGAPAVLSWGNTETYLGGEDHDEAWFEAMLHELCHAACLGLFVPSVGKELPHFVSERLHDLDGISCALQESDTLAAEYFVWCALGLPWGVDELFDLGSFQNVGEEMLQDSLSAPSAKERASVVLDQLYGLLSSRVSS